MAAIYQIKASRDPAERAKCRSRSSIQRPNHVDCQGAQGIIAGCTEIPLELKQPGPMCTAFQSTGDIGASGGRSGHDQTRPKSIKSSATSG